jgi:hypothetical protein
MCRWIVVRIMVVLLEPCFMIQNSHSACSIFDLSGWMLLMCSYHVADSELMIPCAKLYVKSGASVLCI